MAKNKTTGTTHYELLYIISNKYSENELAPVLAKVEEIITTRAGTITHKEEWGKKKLAYPIKNSNYGYYFLSEFDVLGEKLNEIDINLKISSDVIRYQIVKKALITKPKKESKAPANLSESIKKEIKKEKMPKEDQAKEAKKVDLKDLDEKLDKILDVEDLL